MSDITFSVSFTGTPNRDDEDAALLVISAENSKIATEDPPGTPWPFATPAETKASYLSILGVTLTTAHASYTEQAAKNDLETQDVKSLWATATDSQRAAGVAALQA